MKKTTYTEEINKVEHEIKLTKIEMTAPANLISALEAVGHSHPLGDDAKQKLATAREELTLIEGRLQECHDTLKALEKEKEKGFDYERPQKLISRLLPPLPFEAKAHFRDMVKTYTVPRRENAAVLLVAALTFGVWFIATLIPYVLYMGLGALVMGPPAVVTATLASNIVTAVVLLSYAVILYLVMGREKLPFTDTRSVESVAHHFLGAEDWTAIQRVRACGLYSVNTLWAFIIPVIVIPVRFITGLVLLGMYLKVEKSDSKNAQHAVVETGRFLSFVFKAAVYISIGLLIVAVASVLFL